MRKRSIYTSDCAKYIQKVLCKAQILLQPRALQKQHLPLRQTVESERVEQKRQCELKNNLKNKSLYT